MKIDEAKMIPCPHETDYAALQELREPFFISEIKFKVQSTYDDQHRGLQAQAAAHIDPRDVMHRLDKTLGWCNWNTHVSGAREYYVNQKSSKGEDYQAIVCEIDMQLEIVLPSGRRITRMDSGVGQDRKGAVSDAIKRVAVQFGIGQYLYALGRIWVAAEKKGRNTVFKDLNEVHAQYTKAFRRIFGEEETKRYCNTKTKLETESHPAASTAPAKDSKTPGADEVKRQREDAVFKTRVEELKKKIVAQLEWPPEQITPKNVYTYLTEEIGYEKKPDNLRVMLADEDTWTGIVNYFELLKSVSNAESDTSAPWEDEGVPF